MPNLALTLLVCRGKLFYMQLAKKEMIVVRSTRAVANALAISPKIVVCTLCHHDMSCDLENRLFYGYFLLFALQYNPS